MPSPGSNKQHFICLNFHFIRIKAKKKIKKYIFSHSLSLMSGIERRHLFRKHFMNDWIIDHFLLLHILQNCVCLGQLLSVRLLCDAYYKQRSSYKRSILDMPVLIIHLIGSRCISVFALDHRIYNYENIFLCSVARFFNFYFSCGAKHVPALKK